MSKEHEKMLDDLQLAASKQLSEALIRWCLNTVRKWLKKRSK